MSSATALLMGCREQPSAPGSAPSPVPASIAALSPLQQDATVGALLRIGVEVRDSAGKPLPSITVIFTGPAPNYFTFRMPVVTDQDGKAFVSWPLPTTPGTYTAAAIASYGLQLSFQARLSPGAPAQLVADMVLTQAAEAGATLYPGVSVQDAFHNRIRGAAVSFTLGGAQGAAVERPAVVANDSGFAAPGAWTIGTGFGTYTLTARIDGVSAPQATIIFGARVNPPFAVTALAAGLYGGCAIAAQGTSSTYCWGRGFDPARLGNPGSSDSLPTAIPQVPALVSLAVGNAHACGLTSDGSAYCWGNNSRGQTGNPVSIAGAAAVSQVAGQHQFSHLVAGREFTCGLAPDGAAWCWGDNSFGQLGDATQRSTADPVRVADDHVFTSLAAGDQHACGLTTASLVWCWGRNDANQVGAEAPEACQDSTANFYYGGFDKFKVSCALAPLRATVAPPLASISASTNTCGLGTHGTVICWATPSEPQPVIYAAPEPLTQVVAIGTGACALSRSGAVYCVGATASARADTSAAGTPFARVGPSAIVRFLAAGAEHQCAVADGGIAYCWGANHDGQLGNGTRAASNTALPVAAPIP